MAAEQIDRTRWDPFFDNVTKSLIGKQAEIEVASLDVGDQIETEWAPLIGITYDEKDDLIEIALEELDHLIPSPREVFVDYGVGGIVAIAIDDSDGNRQIVSLKNPLALPAPGVIASRGGPMISVLLNVAPDGGQESRLQAALALVKAHGGHITCVQTVGVLPVPLDPTSATTEAEALVDVEEVAHEFQKTVEAGLDGRGVDWTWLRFYGDPATILIERSRFADLIVMSADDSFPPISSVAPHTRTPVLAVRQRNPNFIPERPALIAWNGSVPAANAVHGAMPMFEAMQPVHVLSVGDDSRQYPASLVQEYLVEHEINSEVHWRPSDGKPVADAILECAEEMGIGMIVVGAFGHKRLREMLVGSATRELLEKSSRPLLLSH